MTAFLRLLGANVIGFALPPATRPNLFDAAMLDRNILSIFGDLRNRDAVTSLFAQQQPEIVIHKATQFGPERSFSQPVETCAMNIMGAVHVLEECRYTRSLRAVVIVTDEVGPVANSEHPSGRSLYDSVVSSTELLIGALRKEFFSQPGTALIASAQTADCLAGGDWTEGRLVPEIVQAMANEHTPVEEPNSAQPWQHVLEPLRGFLLLAQNLYEDGPRDLAAGKFLPRSQPISRRDLAARITSLWYGKAREIEADHKNRPGVDAIGWKPLLSFDQALQWTVNWYRAYYENPAMAWPMMEAQIGEYMKLPGW